MILELIASMALVQGFQDQPSDAERQVFAACLEANPDDAACIGSVSSPCMEEPGGDTTIGMIACTSRELRLWDDKLNLHYGDLRAVLRLKDATNRREALLTAQRAWIAYRDAECAQSSLLFEGGTLARVVHVGCVNQMTAERAIQLENQLFESRM